MFFLQNTINDWSNLTAGAVAVSILDTFVARVDPLKQIYHLCACTDPEKCQNNQLVPTEQNSNIVVVNLV